MMRLTGGIHDVYRKNVSVPAADIVSAFKLKLDSDLHVRRGLVKRLEYRADGVAFLDVCCKCDSSSVIFLYLYIGIVILAAVPAGVFRALGSLDLKMVKQTAGRGSRLQSNFVARRVFPSSGNGTVAPVSLHRNMITAV